MEISVKMRLLGNYTIDVSDVNEGEVTISVVGKKMSWCVPAVSLVAAIRDKVPVRVGRGPKDHKTLTLRRSGLNWMLTISPSLLPGITLLDKDVQRLLEHVEGH